MQARGSSRRILPVLAALALWWPFAARAQTTGEITGTVVVIDHGDLVLDLGAASGVAEGDTVEIWRPVKLKHPVTGKPITDRFKIGALQIGQVRPKLSLAVPSGTLTREAEVGDLVLVPSKTATPSRKPSAQAAAKPGEEAAEPKGPSPAADPEASAVATMFDELRGADPATRIRRYEAYVRATPNGRFARVLYEEAMNLRQLLARGPAPRTITEETKPLGPALVSFSRPVAVAEGGTLRFAVELNSAATGALVHVRRAGDVAYRSMPMARVGARYFAASIPSELLVAPELQYFIEATSAREVVPIAGQSDGPLQVEVRRAPRPTPPARFPAVASILTDYADYNRMRGNDKVWQTEGFVGVRFGDVGVRALRSGFGVYRGKGGTIDELDVKNLGGRTVGLTYGYLETELGVIPAFSFIARGAVGLLDTGVSGGAQLLLRIGSDRGTNLMLGGEVLGGVGLRSITQLEWNSFPRFPIVLRTEVTNQPAGASPSSVVPGTSTGQGEVAGRGIVQVGFRPIPSIVLAVRGSVQGRNINHAGPGTGGMVSYEW